MPTKRPTPPADEEWKANRGPDAAIVGGVPIGPLRPGESRTALLPTPPGGLDYREATVTYEADTGEPVALVGPCPDRAHDWYTIGGRSYRASRVGQGEYPRGRREPGEVIVSCTIDGSNGHRVSYYRATPDDRASHLAAFERAAYADAHPFDGPYAYMPDVPWMVEEVRDVDDLLARWHRMGIRAIRLGGSVTLTHPAANPALAMMAGQWHERPGDPDRDLVERWAPLLAARLGGPKVACAVEGCTTDAAVMLVGRVAICRPHLDAPVGETPARRGGLRAAAASVTAALVGGCAGPVLYGQMIAWRELSPLSLPARGGRVTG